MKKVLLVLTVGLLVLAGCGSKGSGEKIEEKTYSIGTAVQNYYTADTNEEGVTVFEANVTYTTVALEGDKIAYVVIDTAQNNIDVKDGVAAEFKAKGTKKELLEDYGMSKVPGSIGEWYEQITAFQKYAVGKTVEEIKAGDPATDLSSSVSINLNSFVEGIEKAAAVAVEVENVARVANASVSGSQVQEDPTNLEIVTTVVAVATNLEGKVLYTFVDETQAKAKITDDAVVIDEGSYVTKGDKKEAYGMSQFGMTEWYLQIEAMKDWAMGKTQSEIKSNGEADLASSVTIYKGSLLNAFDKALEKTNNR